MDYVYSRENTLAHPFHYMYTPYHGAEFLQGYYDNRRAFLARCKASVQLRGEALLPLPEALERTVPCQESSRMLRATSLRALGGERTYDDASAFVRKYEVAKKLRTSYDAEYKPSGPVCTVIEPYVYLAVLCGIQCRAQSSLKFLNCLLKLGDLLVGTGDEIIASVDLPHLAVHAVEAEIEGVRQVAAKATGKQWF